MKPRVINPQQMLESITRPLNFACTQAKPKSKPQQKFNIDIENLLWLPDWQVYWKDGKGYNLGCNDKMAEILHLSSRHAIENTTDYDLVNKNDADQFTKNNQQIMQQGVAAQFHERLSANQITIICFSIKMPLLNNDGSIVGMLGFSRVLKDSPQLISNLTARQEECLYHLVQGMTIKQIAQATQLSPKTVEHYLNAIKNKLNCNTRTDLIKKALQVPSIKEKLLGDY